MEDYLLKEKQSIRDLFNEFISERRYAGKISEETIVGYRRAFELFSKLVPNISQSLLTPHTLTQFFRNLHDRKRIIGRGVIRSGVKKSTIASYWNKLSAFFAWLEAREHIKSNPLKMMKCPVPVYEDRKFLKKEDVDKIIAAIHIHSINAFLFKRNLIIFYLGIFCGLRKEELISLRIDDVDLMRRVLTVRAETSKSKRTRQLPLHTTLITHLQEYLKERSNKTTPFLIASYVQDEGLSFDGLKHLVANLVRDSGVRFHMHQLRHTFAVNFLKQSKNLATLQQLLGHKDIKMTMVYLRCLPIEEMRDEIQKLDLSQLV